MLDDVKSENHRIDKCRGQPVVFRRGKCEHVDILLILAFCCWVGAHDGAASRGDRDGEEGSHDGDDVGGLGGEARTSQKKATLKDPRPSASRQGSVGRKFEI